MTAGKEAFISRKPNGYIYARLMGRAIYAHRAAWAISYGEWPKGDIDHINGDRADNRIANLRDVSRQENMRNAKRNRANRSGVVGVTWCRAARKWQAQIGISGKCKYLGIFSSRDDAVAARRAAERQYGFHENHGRAS